MVRYQRDISKIYIVVGVGCLLLTANLYLFGFKPLTDRLRIEHTHEIDHFLDSGYSLMRAVLDRHIELARQSASRTAIRNKQIDYLNGMISREEFVAFSSPKLADAMNANQEIIGIQRYDTHGEPLFSVGLPPPEEIVTDCDLALLREIRIIGPVSINGVKRLLYCSPIVDRVAGYIGADILVLDDTAIANIVAEAQDGLGHYAIVSEGRIIYWPRKQDESTARSALERCLVNDCANQTYIMDLRFIKDVNWKLYAVVNRNDFFSGINRQLLILFGVALLVTTLVFVFIVIALRPVIRALLREKKLFELSHRDGLTGLYNHAYLQEYVERELERAQRYGHSLSLIMFDLDHFKNVNDKYGHPAGDAVLKNVSEVVTKTVRNIDFAARYGGEEFCLVLPETDDKGAIELAERLRGNIEAKKVQTKAGNIAVTISIGVVTCEACGAKYSKSHLIDAADNALYASKAAGRNQVTSVILSPGAAT